MAINQEVLARLADRAVEDPDFIKRLTADPEGTAAAEGFEIDAKDAETLRSLAGRSEGDVVEVLKSRVSRIAPVDS